MGSDRSMLLEVQNLTTEFVTDDGVATAVDGVSWGVRRGEILAIVGESGCGKSVTAMSVMRLIPTPPGRIVGGRVLLHSEAGVAAGGENMAPIDLLSIPDREMRRVRGARVAMIFQEPMSALNPVMTVGAQIVEAIRLHRGLNRRDAYASAVDLLQRVGIPAPEKRVHDYPHQLSGGMRQRVMIAMGLSCNPELLIADEPTTALDVTVQAQIIELLLELRDQTGMGVVLITHDLGVVAEMADRVCVMYAGRIVESADTQQIFSSPLHPYTQGLLHSLPRIDRSMDRLNVIPGQVPDPLHFPPGCRFHPRCDLTRRLAADGGGDRSTEVLERCIRRTETKPGGDPPLRDVSTDHGVACWEAPGYESGGATQ